MKRARARAFPTQGRRGGRDTVDLKAPREGEGRGRWKGEGPKGYIDVGGQWRHVGASCREPKVRETISELSIPQLHRAAFSCPLFRRSSGDVLVTDCARAVGIMDLL